MSARDDRYEEATAADAEEYLLSEHEPVEVSVSSTLLTAFAFRLEPDDVRRLRERARAQGVKPTQLVRAWVLERLTTEDKVPLEADEALSTLRRLVAHRVRAGRGRSADEAHHPGVHGRSGIAAGHIIGAFRVADPDIDPLVIAAWAKHPNDHLDKRTLAERVQSGQDFDGVIRAARLAPAPLR